jgi:hypothetical protein
VTRQEKNGLPGSPRARCAARIRAFTRSMSVCRLAPRHRRLERLAHDPVPQHEVPDVCDAEGQHVAALAVVGTALEAAMPLRHAVDVALLPDHLPARPLEDQRRRHHAVGVEAERPGHQPLLGAALQLLRPVR